MIKIRCVLFITLLISFQIFSGQKSTIEEVIDKITQKHFEDSQNKGLSVGIIDGDSVQFFYFGGKHTKEIKDVGPNTLFELGSITKLYTVHVFNELEKLEVISRTDLLSKYLPVEIYEGKKWNNQIRLVDVITHTSGLPPFSSTRELEAIKGFNSEDPYKVFDSNFILNTLKELNIISNYGTVSYSNFGYGVIGYVMQEATSTPFENLFENFINIDLGLTNTYLKIPEEQFTNVATPHKGDEQVPLIQLYSLSPAGSVKSTLPDVMKFLKYYLDTYDTSHHTKSILSDQYPNADGIVPLGWGTIRKNNIDIFFHVGGTYGSNSIVCLIPEKKIGISILSNNKLDNGLSNYLLEIVDFYTK